jgi:hypothetical protein
MGALPTGTVTFFFTDIEGSTTLRSSNGWAIAGCGAVGGVAPGPPHEKEQ